MKMREKKTHKWVVGFLIRNKKEVALVLKTHPKWQKGYLNGVGGNIEKGEAPLQAMRRECKEEAGLNIKSWREFAYLKVQNGTLHFFVAHGSGKLRSVTDEKVSWYKLNNIPKLRVIPDLRWLLPLALDPGNIYTKVDYIERLALKKT